MALEGGFAIPTERGSVHYEAEIAVLIGKPLSAKPSREEVLNAISGFAPALDLTLRDKQAELKAKGLAVGNRQVVLMARDDCRSWSAAPSRM